MAHRGRLTLLANVVGKGMAQLFSEFEGDIDPESIEGQGDVKYHLGATSIAHDVQRQERSRFPSPPIPVIWKP